MPTELEMLQSRVAYLETALELIMKTIEGLAAIVETQSEVTGGIQDNLQKVIKRLSEEMIARAR